MKMSRNELVQLVQDLMDVKIPEEKEEEVMDILERETSDPNILDYIYHSDPPLSAEDVVDLALGVRPIEWSQHHSPSGHAADAGEDEETVSLVRQALKCMQETNYMQAKQFAEQALSVDPSNAVAQQVIYVARRALNQM